MNLLLDTHVLLWWLDDDPTLGEKARDMITDGSNLAFVSAAVIWEIRIKEAIGKLSIPKNFKGVLDQQPFEMLDITAEHAHMISALPLYHRDPFDRMLIAQAKVERLSLVTRDVHFKKYKIQILKA